VHVHRQVPVLSASRLQGRLLLALGTLPAGGGRIGLVLVHVGPGVGGHLGYPTQSHARVQGRVVVEDSRHCVLLSVLGLERLHSDWLALLRADGNKSTRVLLEHCLDISLVKAVFVWFTSTHLCLSDGTTITD